MRSAPLVALLIAAVLVAPATAQTPAPAFTASSVTPNTSGGSATGFQIFPGGQFRATNATLRQLVQAAYDFKIERFQIVGGPSWIDVDRFDVQATPAGDSVAPGRQATAEEIAKRVQVLLADRFKLALRREIREMDRFELVVSRPSSSLKVNGGSCVPPQARMNEDKRPRCGVSYRPDTDDAQHLVAVGVPMTELARRLQQQVEAAVIDKTSLPGLYDFTLDYLRARGLQGAADSGGGVSIFTAVHEQLGLRLERVRGPAELYVIDSAQKPTDN